MSYDYLFKIILIGEQGAGKTSVVKRLIDDRYTDFRETTIGLDFSSHKFDYNGKRYKYHFWDTAGQECFSPIIKAYYKNIACCFVVISTDDKEWEENAVKWLERYNMNKDDDVRAKPILLVNKIDILEKEFSMEESKRFAEDNGCLYYEVSAKTGANMRHLLKFLTENIVENMDEDELGPGITRGVVNLDMFDKANTRNCLYFSCF
jgi:small GTP-binding protein